MSQLATDEKPVTKIYRRDSIDFLRLTVRVLGTPTTNYATQVQPAGTDSDLAGTWNTPDTAGADTGFRVNGPALGGGLPGVWSLYLKITDSPQVVVRRPVIIRLT